MQNQKRTARGGLNLVDAYRGVEPEDERETAAAAEAEEDEQETAAGIAEIMALGLAPMEQAAEINAFVTKMFARRGPAGGVPRGRPEGPGRFQAPRSASAPHAPATEGSL